MAENAHDTVKVLMLPYAPVQFLINRSQCSSSVFISEVEARSAIGPWLREDLVSGGLRVPLFDLDLFLQDCFRVQAPDDAHVALIRTWDSFSAEIRQSCLVRGLEKGTPVAFRVTSAAVMADMELQDFSLCPASVQPYLRIKGVSALALPPGRGMQYLLDLDILLADCLLGGCNESVAG